jgi:hypothetical protein
MTYQQVHAHTLLQQHYTVMSLFSYVITVVFPPWAVHTNIRNNI